MNALPGRSQHEEDEALERQIDAARDRFLELPRGTDQQRKAFEEMRRLIGLRSSEQIERMERRMFGRSLNARG